MVLERGGDPGRRSSGVCKIKSCIPGAHAKMSCIYRNSFLEMKLRFRLEWPKRHTSMAPNAARMIGNISTAVQWENDNLIFFNQQECL